jgi:hypothetical protein
MLVAVNDTKKAVNDTERRRRYISPSLIFVLHVLRCRPVYFYY